MNWKDIISKKKSELILTITFLVVMLFILSKFLTFVEHRDGVVLPDPVLKLFNPVDVTWIIFGLLYTALISTVIYFFTKPELLLTAFQTYIVLTILRIIMMYLTPFNAPQDSIILDDPFVQAFRTSEIFTKDLFFSGHTAILFVLYLVADKTYLKVFLLVCTILIGLAVLVQHVHYTIDVVAAPIFAYMAYMLVKLIRNKLNMAVK